MPQFLFPPCPKSLREITWSSSSSSYTTSPSSSATFGTLHWQPGKDLALRIVMTTRDSPSAEFTPRGIPEGLRTTCASSEWQSQRVFPQPVEPPATKSCPPKGGLYVGRELQGAAGSSSVNVEPLPNWLSTLTVPFMRSMMCL